MIQAVSQEHDTIVLQHSPSFGDSESHHLQQLLAILLIRSHKSDVNYVNKHDRLFHCLFKIDLIKQHYYTFILMRKFCAALLAC